MSTCDSGNTYNGEHLGARISSVFVVFAVSAIGSFLPLVCKMCPQLRLPNWVFFVLKNIGSGVIVATGFIHLLAESLAVLRTPCLGSTVADFQWAEALALMGVFVMFSLDVFAHRKIHKSVETTPLISKDEHDEGAECTTECCAQKLSKEEIESLYLRILNSVVLEFGIVFHSVFVGLTLAISGSEFKTLYIAIAFHQLFEGFGLGSRFALTPWPKNKKYLPWLLALIYSLTTPVAIAIGLGVRHSYPPGSREALLVTGIFYGFCAGLLIYSSLVELMAYDLMWSKEFEGPGADGRTILAFIFLALGAFAASYIGRYA